MGNISQLKWIESSPTSILIQDNPEVWHSGRAIDLLHLGGNRLLVGTDRSGLWVCDHLGGARPLSDNWEYPDVRCLTRRGGPGPDAFFCGTDGALYANIPDVADPRFRRVDPVR